MRIVGSEPGMSFYVCGSADEDSIVVEPDVGVATVVLRVPIQALPWRDVKIIEKHGPRMPYGCNEAKDPLADMHATLEEPEEVVDRTGIEGAERLVLHEGVATVQLGPGARLIIPCLQVVDGAQVPAAVQVTGTRAAAAKGTIRVYQLSGGRRVGGVTLELREKQEQRKP